MAVNKQPALDIRMRLSANNQTMTISVNRIAPSVRISVERGAVLPETYTGPYEAAPILYDDVVLETAWRVLDRNITVHPITIHEVSNPKGGRTVTIGAI